MCSIRIVIGFRFIKGKHNRVKNYLWLNKKNVYIIVKPPAIVQLKHEKRTLGTNSWLQFYDRVSVHVTPFFIGGMKSLKLAQTLRFQFHLLTGPVRVDSNYPHPCQTSHKLQW